MLTYIAALAVLTVVSIGLIGYAVYGIRKWRDRNQKTETEFERAFQSAMNQGSCPVCGQMRTREERYSGLCEDCYKSPGRS